jgi:hypothetical protein
MTVTMGVINKLTLGKAELAKSRLQRVSKKGTERIENS